jgi:hypothetical protein
MVLIHTLLPIQYICVFSTAFSPPVGLTKPRFYWLSEIQRPEREAYTSELALKFIMKGNIPPVPRICLWLCFIKQRNVLVTILHFSDDVCITCSLFPRATVLSIAFDTKGNDVREGCTNVKRLYTSIVHPVLGNQTARLAGHVVSIWLWESLQNLVGIRAGKKPPWRSDSWITVKINLFWRTSM